MEYLELQNTQTLPSDAPEYSPAQLPALTHFSSCLNSNIYSLLHTLFHEISPCFLGYIMKITASEIHFLERYDFYDVCCHLFACFSSLLPPSFSSVMTQLVRAP